jgi:hypothetical protein
MPDVLPIEKLLEKVRDNPRGRGSSIFPEDTPLLRIHVRKGRRLIFTFSPALVQLLGLKLGSRVCLGREKQGHRLALLYDPAYEHTGDGWKVQFVTSGVAYVSPVLDSKFLQECVSMDTAFLIDPFVRQVGSRIELHFPSLVSDEPSAEEDN